GAYWGPTVGGAGDEVLDGRLFVVRDETGAVLLQTARRVYPDDEYIDERNDWYRVVRVSGREAVARLLGPIDLRAELERPLPVWTGEPAVRAASPREVTVGIYHTHNDESYITDQGAASVEGRGGIHQVGDRFARALRREGFRVYHDESIHLPHDRGAYRRSRRTAVELIRARKADLLFDVHRDAGPGEAYARKVKGKWVTQVRIVVGRQNPNRDANLRFAKQLKAVADDVAPGLVKGIWFGLDSYNQDLGPRVLLLELGTEENAMQSAERGIELFADVVRRWAVGQPR
ncbi:MAG: stage II sporulation protein P, partial [Clostridia bacterium]|nr:stage II sporulation protein P [Clostridia bacterium]